MTNRDLVLSTDFDPTLALLLAMLDDATEEWRWELADLKVEDEALVWQPFPGGYSIGAILLHMADVESYWIEEVAAGRPFSPANEAVRAARDADQYKLEWAAPAAEPLAWYLEIANGARKRTKEIVRELADPLHAGLKDNGETCTLRWILSHVIQHEAYHGGQVVMLAVEFQKR